MEDRNNKIPGLPKPLVLNLPTPAQWPELPGQHPACKGEGRALWQRELSSCALQSQKQAGNTFQSNFQKIAINFLHSSMVPISPQAT